MFTKILVANRGEIACRIIRTARRLGIITVAVYSDADRDALHVSMADEAVNIGGAAAKDSYLNIEQILDACNKTGAEAVHPGYGFLSENSRFAQRCAEKNIVFVGPPVSAIESMGSKSTAKAIMQQAGVPLLPGYHGEEQQEDFLAEEARKVGYPVLLKAAAGGGGKGMRLVESAEQFKQGLQAARREAISSFGDDKMLVEKYLTAPRHVEVQVFCDSLGNGIYLGDRDCSVQRRHQKIIEEAPAPGLSDETRSEMGAAAVRCAKAIDYVGAGTVEFLFAESGEFYFMEMNTRLQVEHPVTEMVCGQDLVEWQLLIAAGQELPLNQDQVAIRGHAFEARIYAEDPVNDFLPATGRLHLLRPPIESDQVRVDTGVREGDEVSVYYDPMIAKLIVKGDTRNAALDQLRLALSHYLIGGVTTNVEFLYNLATNPAFREAKLTTAFIDVHKTELFEHRSIDRDTQILTGSLLVLQKQKQKISMSHSFAHESDSPWNSTSYWRTNSTHVQMLALQLNDEEIDCEVHHGGKDLRIVVNDKEYIVGAHLQDDVLITTVNGHRQRFVIAEHDSSFTLYSDRGAFSVAMAGTHENEEPLSRNSGDYRAPMNGTIVALLAEPGKAVMKGDPVLVMEAMKMEHSVCASEDGQVEQFYFQPGDLVTGGAQLFEFHPST